MRAIAEWIGYLIGVIIAVIIAKIILLGTFYLILRQIAKMNGWEI